MKPQYPLLLLSLCALPALAADEFGSDWDDPRTADAAIERPDTPSCTLEIVNHGFANFEPYRNQYIPPQDCPGPWTKVVLDLHGDVAGVQYDRLGHLEIGGVTVLTTSTPEPSREGIQWHVEKDISAYAPLLSEPQPVIMYLGNLVNDTYTGVLNIRTTLTFYQADKEHKALETADRILRPTGLHRDGADLVGSISLPRNTRRLEAEVYATGSGGGCEEFWYFTAPAEAGYSCGADDGPYREVQVWLDGRLAGMALPYPHIYTGGWANPFLWYVLPAPRAFNIKPLRYDLTPFAGLLNDGQAHELRLRVLGVSEGQSGWALRPSLFLWQDHELEAVQGGLLAYQAGELVNDSQFQPQDDGTFLLATRGSHALDVTGYLDTSKGRVTTRVERRLSHHNDHGWDQGEWHDGIDAWWRDEARVTTSWRDHFPVVRERSSHFGVDGLLSVEPVDGHYRITTDMRLFDHGDNSDSKGPRTIAWSRLRAGFEGSASWSWGVPRAERNATGWSVHEVSEQGSKKRCYRRRIATENGFITGDDSGCSK
ncbi:peptide-N4-asparagine amidase [Gallaecimonas sp. GXIMD4217]|uniref:peptide-N4-asparagine amidase n=1 Tax=Gallaecimonas sp. GXIMD4217 TaxID=3131927 RepID=UPI00311B0951